MEQSEFVSREAEHGTCGDLELLYHTLVFKVKHKQVLVNLKLKRSFENEKIELEIKYKNLLEENKSLEKINQNYENNKKLLYQGLEEEKKKLIDNIIKEINTNWSQKLREKIIEIKKPIIIPMRASIIR